MAPTLHMGTTLATLAKRNLEPNMVGILVPIIIVGLAVIAAAVFFLVRWIRQRQYQEVSDGNTQKTSSPMLGKRKTSSLQKMADEEELERANIIRKSLASRVSSRQSDHDYLPAPDYLHDDHYDDETRSKRISLIEDWKEFEAGLTLQKSASLGGHPALGVPPRKPSPSAPVYPPISSLSEVPRRKPAPPPKSARRSMIEYSHRNSWRQSRMQLQSSRSASQSSDSSYEMLVTPNNERLMV